MLTRMVWQLFGRFPPDFHVAPVIYNRPPKADIKTGARRSSAGGGVDVGQRLTGCEPILTIHVVITHDRPVEKQQF